VVNVVPTAYRQVSVAKVDVALTEQNLQQLFLGRECYRRTRYVVMHHGDDTALIEVTLQGTEALFSPAVAVRLLAGAQDTVYVRDPDIDTAMCLGCGHPMGPFTLLDVVGNDTTLRIADIMVGEYKDARYEAPALLRRLVAEGRYGRKSGKGFYDYSVDPPTPMAGKQ